MQKMLEGCSLETTSKWHRCNTVGNISLQKKKHEEKQKNKLRIDFFVGHHGASLSFIHSCMVTRRSDNRRYVFHLMICEL